jgi:hypothetical protein
MDCKGQMLKKLNAQFRWEGNGFSFEGKKHEFSELDVLKEEIRKICGYTFDIGFVDPQDSQTDEENEENDEEPSDDEAENTGQSSGSDEGSDGESFQCIACENAYATPIALIMHMERRHIQLNKVEEEASHRKMEEGHCCRVCGCQYTTKANLQRHVKSQHNRF